MSKPHLCGPGTVYVFSHTAININYARICVIEVL